MTNARILLEELKKKNWVNLSHKVNDEIPHFEAFDKIDIKDVASIDKDGFWGSQISIATQYGTHIDAPNHFAKNTRSLLEIPFKERCLNLFVIDVSKEVKDNPDYEVSLDDIKAFEEKHGQIEANSFVALRSDWSKRFSDKDAFVNKDKEGIEHTPGWSLEALKFLNEERRVTAIGHETLNTDSGLKLYENKSLEAEYYWLSQDKYQVEILNNLDKVPSIGGIIIISFPQIENISGFNASVTAIF